MNTPEESFETAVKKSVSREPREEAIDHLSEANECDKLAVLVQMGGLDGSYRRYALNALAEARCRPMLRTIVERGNLDESLQNDAERLLRKTEET